MLFCTLSTASPSQACAEQRTRAPLAADWAFMSTWLWIHILAVPTLQQALGLKSLYSVFALHWVSQIIFHRNLNKCADCDHFAFTTRLMLPFFFPPLLLNRILVHHLKGKHGLLIAEKPRSRVGKKERVWTKIGGLIGSFLRILSLFLATWHKPAPFSLGATWIARLCFYTISLDFLFYWCPGIFMLSRMTLTASATGAIDYSTETASSTNMCIPCIVSSEVGQNFPWRLADALA